MLVREYSYIRSYQLSFKSLTIIVVCYLTDFISRITNKRTTTTQLSEIPALRGNQTISNVVAKSIVLSSRTARKTLIAITSSPDRYQSGLTIYCKKKLISVCIVKLNTICFENRMLVASYFFGQVECWSKKLLYVSGAILKPLTVQCTLSIPFSRFESLFALCSIEKRRCTDLLSSCMLYSS